jgi:CheY-like chemotaxis protein
MTRPPTVAIVNTSPDTIELLRQPLERAGFVVVSCYTYDIRDGKVDFQAFLDMHHPQVIAYDIAVPYTKNFRLYEHIRSIPAVEHTNFVLTSTNARVVQKLVGRDDKVYEVIDRKEDLDRIIQAIKDASRARPTR